jgi:hypothetical protein
MVDEERMTVSERRKYLARVQERYLAADRAKKKELLDEMELVTGLHRKSLVRLLRPAGLARTKRTSQRGKVYGREVQNAIRIISESLDYLCAERLTPSLLPTARHLAKHSELTLSPKLETDLAKISVSTVQRILSRLTRDSPKLPRKGPSQANRLRRDVPMTRIAWNEQTPGHFETDLVHHSGQSGAGDYVHTLQMIDVALGWSERTAILGRSQKVMEEGFRKVLDRLPFPVVEIHPDNGSEFFNDHLLRFWKNRLGEVKLSRSRPYHKNDNRFVEQKNDTLVRAYLGHVRLDSQKERDELDELYDRMWLYYNFFQPVLRLEKKVVEGSRVRRRWDEARTPFERLCETTAISAEKKEQLRRLMEKTNPRALRREIYERLDRLLTRSTDEPALKGKTAA